MTAATSEPALIEVRGLSKRYPGVLALDDVSLGVRAGEVHVLFGENGAGKSTLISILAGANQPTAGEIRFRGEPMRLASVHDARARGISAVFQEFSLVPQMTVAENLFLGAEVTVGGLLAKRRLKRMAVEIIDRLGFPLKPNARVETLTRSEQQMVEIAKAFRAELNVLILDEPTASLTERETDQLFELVARLKAGGVGIIYITHRMQEIRRIADRITVLRDGKFVATEEAGVAEGRLIELMTGREIAELFPEVRSEIGDVRLTIADLTTARHSVDAASLDVRAGEIVGLAGLVGSGKSEVMRAAFGLERIQSGTVHLDGEDVTGRKPGEMMDRGLFYVPPDRRDEGLVMIRPVRENITLPALAEPPLAKGLGLDRRAEKRLATTLAERMELRPMRIERTVDHFSGGNQQKVLLAKCLTRETKVYVFDEPTVGVDVGTRAAIYRFIADLAERGAAVVLISSDLPEILHMSHRAIVFYRGRIRAEFEGEAITEEALLSHFFEREAA
ncbi:sugar ABC transporter ATP-binding protein [Acuticoccus sp. M5D2P5]|uniref:sugar ABC transporter ATP-binding protein n=1 Tax=Acuticoccus kalidii TaxID=2910977 RepID=UPI001F3A1632|nr:sugar ABC transporter ATP-binding protein [Acuticoccus kalidii]MCF3934234.1 sugar ABC transporter ATP-binding protein [Acuticoccus kalidii]